MSTRPERRVRLPLLPVGGTAVALVACAAALRWTGATDPLVFVDDAGPLVRWGGPLVQVVHAIAASLVLASLLFLVTVLRPDDPKHPGASRAGSRALRVARWSAVAWALTSLASVVLVFADASGLRLTDPRLLEAVVRMAWDVDATRIGVVVAAASVAVTVALHTPNPTRARLLALLAVTTVALWSLGLASHTGTSADHETSVNAMGVHIVSAAAWLGGLLMLVAIRSRLADDSDLLAAVRRWSHVAAWAYAGVGVSGVVAATTRLASWEDVGTAYGLLLVLKAAAFVVLGVAGWWHRRSTIAALGTPARHAFWRLVVGEVVVLLATFGVAAALARSAPPAPESMPDPSAALALTGYPPPPPATAWSVVTTWRVDWFLVAVALLATSLYAAGLVRARRAGRAWPVGRLTAWVAGWAVFVVVTSGGVGTHGRVALSWHVAGLFVLFGVVGPLLAHGEPARLALLTIRPRADRSLGVREMVVAMLRSRVGTALARPATAAAVVSLALVLLVLGGGLGWSLWSHPGHLMLTLGAPVLGLVLGSAVAQASRARRRGSAVLAVVAVTTVHAALGLGLFLSTQLVAADFLVPLGLRTPDELLDDQHVAGLVVWTTGLASAAVLLATTRPRGRA